MMMSGNDPKPSTCQQHKDVTLVLDVIISIIDYLSVDLGDNTCDVQARRRDLLHFALASRSVKESSLNALWRSLDSFYPLFALLPTFCLQGNQYVLRGIPDGEHWLKFNYYARKIEEIHYRPTETEDAKIAPCTYLAVFNPILPHRYLPNLKAIHLLQPSFIFLSLFSASQELSSLDFSGILPPGHAFISNALSVIHHNSDHLTTLALPAAISEDIIGLATDLRHLQSLSLGERNTISLPMLKKLGELRNLGSLTLSVTESFGSGNQRDFANLGFIGLQKLKLAGPLDVAVSVLGGMDASGLRDVDIDFNRQRNPKPEMLAVLLKSIGRKWPSLRRVTIASAAAWANAGAANPTKFADMLQDFADLESLVIDIPSSPGLSPMAPDEVISFVGGHPKLRKLDLPPFNIVSFSTLIRVARACPFFISLRIHLGTEDMPTLPECEALRTRLRYLAVGASDFKGLSTAMELARRLNRLFPLLEIIESDGDGPTKQWQTVQTLLRFAHATRDDEFDRPKVRV